MLLLGSLYNLFIFITHSFLPLLWCTNVRVVSEIENGLLLVRIQKLYRYSKSVKNARSLYM